MNVRKFAIIVAVLVTTCIERPTVGQEMKSVLIESPIALVSSQNLEEPSSESQDPSQKTGCGCAGAAWSDPLLEEGSWYVLKQVGSQTIFALRNPIQPEKALSLTVTWDTESGFVPAISSITAAEPAVEEPDCALASVKSIFNGII